MNQERLLWRGQKQEKETEAKGLEIAIKGLIENVRMGINPHAPIDEINADLLSQNAFDLCNKVTRYKEVKAEIANINKSLGIE